jgi:predicted dehydrogenase
MNNSKVNLGFIGVGMMGQAAHLRNFATLHDCQVVAIAELRENTARCVAQRYGVPRVYRDYHDMLAQERMDGLVCIQPFNRHGVLLMDVFRAGLPILSEKPLAASVEVGERLVQAAQAAGTWHMVAYHKRSDPATLCAREYIAQFRQSSELGALRYARITMPPGDWIAGGFSDLVDGSDPAPELDFDPPAADLSPADNEDYVRFVNYYIHQVNLMRFLLGEPYRVVYADPHEVLLVGESASGVTCTIEMSPYRTTMDWQESALVCFERGYVRLDLPAPLALNRAGRVEVFKDPAKGVTPQRIEPQLPPVHAHRQQAINFVRAIRGECKPPCDSVEALEDLRLARDYFRLLRGR